MTETVQSQQAEGRWASRVSSLRVRNYRLYFSGQLISVCGTWMQTVAQSFLVLDLTHSGAILGLVTGARFAPIFLFGPWGGVIADRFDGRRVMIVTQALSGLLALTFGVLISAHAIQLWTVFMLASLLGLVNVFDSPVRQTLISELVPREQLSNAVTLNSIMVNMGRVFGASIGGTVVAELGLAPCFDLNAASFVAVLATLYMITADRAGARRPVAREPGQVREGLRYIRSRTELLIPLLMVALVGTLAWEFQVSLPLLARDTFGGGARTYGLMASVMGAGAVVGGLVTAARTPRHRSLAIAAIGWGIAITAAAVAPDLALEYIALVFVGYGSIAFNSVAKTTLQLSADPPMRGRVMALWAVAWAGSTPIGGPIVGWLAGEFGARWGLLVGGIPTLAIGVWALPVLSAVDRRKGRPGPSVPDQRAEPVAVDVADAELDR